MVLAGILNHGEIAVLDEPGEQQSLSNPERLGQRSII
jgi:hypothetical protein